MDRIDLPYLSGDVPLAAVFDRMAASGVHAAIVAPPGREPVLVTNRDVDDALERGVVHVGEIGGRPLHVVGAEIRDREWETALDDASASYGVVRERRWEPEHAGGAVSFEQEARAASMVTIVTRHEGLAEEIRSAGEVCRCEKYKHRAPKGRPCPYCSSAVRCA